MIKYYKKYLESVKWYSKGKFTFDNSVPDNIEVDDQELKVGDYVYPEKINNIYWWDDNAFDVVETSIKNNGKWRLTCFLSDEPIKIIKTDYCEDIDGYTGKLLQLEGKWPWYKADKFKKDFSFNKKNEGVKWYSKGKLIPDDNFKDDMGDNTEFIVGDILYVEYPDYYFYWGDNEHQDKYETSVYNKGHWLSINKKINYGVKVINADYCEDIDGYTGQIIQLNQGYWPWFQTTNFKKK